MSAVLVAGAAGGIGEHAVRALLETDGVTVFATSRSAERLETVRERLAPELRKRFVPIVGDAGDFHDAEDIAARIGARGGIDAAVAILGRGWWTSGALLDLTPETWNAILHEMLTSHFAFARAIVPLLARRPESVYLSIGGGAAFAPSVDAGLVSVAAAGQAMLTRVVARERGAAPPRVVELVIDGPVNTNESRAFAKPNWIRDDEAGRVAADLALGAVPRWEALRFDGPLVVMSERAV